MKINLPEAYRKPVDRSGSRKLERQPGERKLWNVTHYEAVAPTIDEHVVIINDSFINVSRPFLTALFRRTTFVHWGIAKKRPKAIFPELERADTIIMQTVEDLSWQRLTDSLPFVRPLTGRGDQAP